LRHYSFKPGWKMSLGFLVAFALFLRLGFWQIDRGQQRQALVDIRAERHRDAPLVLDGREPDPDELRYRRVTVTGEYDPAHQFILDNQVHRQQPGYYVLTPLRIAGGNTAVLVNRGWRPWGPDRKPPADLALRETSVRLTGTLDRFPRVGLKLEGADRPAPGWPSVVQVAEPARLAERLGFPVLPVQVLLDETASEGFVRAWHEVPLDPGKNYGYALQWFLFAAVAASLYLWFGFKSRPSTP
jgi:surfeit locus 1 family protein